jgi:hypothetical protein
MVDNYTLIVICNDCHTESGYGAESRLDVYTMARDDGWWMMDDGDEITTLCHDCKLARIANAVDNITKL